jgi:3-oxoacyl-[acyl-carrier protein] reductase
MKLESQVAIVTASAGAGIGQATARSLAADGADVVVTDIHVQRTQETTAALEAEFGRPFLGLELDVTNEERVNAVVAHVLEAKGQIDIVVNNAAWNDPCPIWEMSTARWRKVMDMCLTSQFFVSRAVLPSMIERKSGCIINISSGAAWVASEWGDSAYSAAKAGVLGMTRAVASEVGRHGIRVNAVAPDLIWNPYLAKMYPEEYFEEKREQSVSGRIGEPQDIARIVHFLATDSYLTGQVINASGGFYMHP